MSARMPTAEELGRWALLCEDRATDLRRSIEARISTSDAEVTDITDAAEAWDDLAGFLRDRI